jgi:hypothetical protein
VHVLVRGGVEPVVALEQRLGRDHHQLVELAERDGAAGLDLLLGERRDPGERLRAVEELDGHLPRRRPAEVLLQRGALRLQRLEDVGHQHLVLALRVGDDEVLALEARVVPGQVAGVLRQLEVEVGLVAADLLEEPDRLVVPLLVEAQHAQRELHRALVAVRIGERLDERARALHVLVVQRGHAAAQGGDHGVGAGAGGGEGDEQRHHQGPHFTSSS